MKAKFIVGAMCSGAVLLIAFYFRRVPQAESPAPVTAPKSEVADGLKTNAPSTRTSRQAIAGDAPNNSEDEYVLALRDARNGIGGLLPFATRVLRLYKEHPELGLTLADARAIQEIYNSAHQRTLDLQVALAKVSKINATQNYVEIPSYRDEATLELVRFEKEVSTFIGDQRSSAVLEQLSPSFVDDNDNLGAHEVGMTVSCVLWKDGDFLIQKEMRHLDPITGEYSGAESRTEIYVTKGSMDEYLGQESFFPTGSNN